ncbi:MAG TPA: rRNA adenine N-6-methyltransferase family protein [Acetobacteraceae bacterium]|nr:rRNA adenine N-6-methyltransferase family protein [Acetobacteraceae bacterium]
MDVDTARQAFAEELRYVAHVRSDRVIAAFATVPREQFLGAPPWQVFDLADGYWELPGDDPGAAYHNVLFAIDAARELNNGHPEFWARLLDKLDIRAGDKVFHVGAGVGYYTAIIAELAGADGAVAAVEIDPGLAKRARANLASRANVQVIAADGAVFDPGPVDVIVVNAGATQPMRVWLDALMPGGRMLLPLTAENGHGTVFRIERLATPGTFAAAAISGVRIYPCAGARSAQAARLLARALGDGGQRFVRSLRLDQHAREGACWLHGDGYCLSLQR